MSGLAQKVAERIDLVDDERRMRLSLRLKVGVDANVDRARTQPKPASVATLKPGWLLFFNHSQESHEECARLVLTFWRNRE